MRVETIQRRPLPVGNVKVMTRDELLHKVRGRTIHLPSLKNVLSDWKGITTIHVSPHVEQLRHLVRDRFASLSFSQEKQKHLLASDFGLFTALWWPDAPVEQLEVLAYLIIWLFTWDDEIDEPSGSFSEDFAAAESYRNDTLKFVGICLGLTPKEPGFVPKNHIVQSFDVIGAALRSSYDTTQCRRFYDEIAGLMAASQLEQDHRLSGNLPTLEEYWTFRLGTSAVYIGTAVGEYSLSVRLPLHIMQSESMKSIWTETNIIISITNDLLSLRKEIVRGCIDSIVPLAFVSMDDTSTVIAHTINALRASKNRFDLAAEALVGEARQSNCIDDVQRFIQVQRSNCVGNLVWSLQTQRYMMAGVTNEDGSHTFVL